MEEVIPKPTNPSMGKRAARGALATILGQALRLVIQLTGIVVLSRILGPTTIGLYAVLMVLVSFGEVLRDFGLSSAMIQAKEVNQAQRSNLFWINASIGLALAAVCVGIAPLVAMFYREPQLTAACAAVAAVFLFGGVDTQFRAQLTRNLRFTAISCVDVVSPLLGLVVGIGLAVSGFGLWALVAQQVITSAITVFSNVLLARWVPSMPSRDAGTRQLLVFGWHVGCIQAINTLAKNVDTIIVGRLFGPSSLGIYTRAFQLMTVPLNQLSTPATKVAFPILSRLRGEPERYNRYLLSGQRALVHLVAFIFVYSLALAPPLVEIALGSEWRDVTPIYRILAVGALAQAASFATYWVFLSQGKTKDNLRLTLVTRSILIAAVIGGSNWGVFGVAAAYSAVIVVTWPFSLYWLHRVAADVPTSRMFWQVIAQYAVYGVAGLGAYCATMRVEDNWLQLLIGAGAYLLILAAAYWTVKSYGRDLREIAAFRHLLRKGASVPM